MDTSLLRPKPFPNSQIPPSPALHHPTSIMPPPPRPRRARRRSAAAADTPRSNGSGWLSVRRGHFKRDDRGEYGDNGLPLGDETLLLVFSGLSDTKDLVRCAATCKRWLRLVSTDAAFICRRAPPSCDRFIRRLALGFFHNHHHDAAGGSSNSLPLPPPHFVPLASSPSLRQLSLGTLVDGERLDSSRAVASRNGRVVLGLRRSKSAQILRLCVCDPMNGNVDVLPALRGKDAPGPYACTVLTAADGLRQYVGNDARCTPSSYRVLVVYNRRSFTALRCYSSDAATWGPEAEVTGARIGRMRLGGTTVHPAIVRGGTVCWPGLAVTLEPSTLRLAPEKLPYTVRGSDTPRRHDTNKSNVDRLLGVMPGGRLCVVEADSKWIRAYIISDGTFGNHCRARKVLLWAIEVAMIGPERVHTVKLRWFYDKSGVVLFTARNGYADMVNTYAYTVDVETRQVCRVAGGESLGEGEMCGYEMDQVVYLASLAS